MNGLASWNGVIQALDELRIPATDRGFLFGDSVYEVIRVYQGRPFYLNAHMDRLAASLAGIRISCELQSIPRQISELLEKSELGDGIVYIQISRGSGPRRHVPLKPLTPNCLIYVQELSREICLKKRAVGLRVALAEDLRHSYCGLKTSNLLPAVLALMSAADHGLEEAILCSADGHVHEGSHTNVAIFRGNSFVTPPLNGKILPGITRQLALDLAQQLGLDCLQREISQDELLSADELVLLGTTTEIMPVIEVAGQLIGDGKPGPRSQQMIAAFDQVVARC